MGFGFGSLDGFSEEDQIKAVRRNGARIQDITAPSDAVKLAAVSGDMAALALPHIKDPSPELCRVAVEHNGHAIKVVPIEQRSSDLWDLALRRHGEVIGYLKDAARTPAVLKEAAPHDPEALKFFTAAEQTEDICVAVVKKWGGQALKYILKQTPRICWEAVHADPRARKYVFPEFKKYLNR